MKKFLTGRTGAIIVAVILILLSVYFGAYRSLHVAAAKIADGFNEGVYWTDNGGGTYIHKSIRSQLINRVEACTTLVSVANNFDEVSEDTKNLKDAANELKNLIYGTGTPAELCEANRNLTRAFDRLYPALLPLATDKRDIEYIENTKTEMDGAASTIETAGYNESVREFNRSTLSIFPSNILKVICFVECPELFE